MQKKGMVLQYFTLFMILITWTCYGAGKLSPEVQKKIDAYKLKMVRNEPNDSNPSVVTFDTFRADSLEQKRPYGFSVDQFFGAAAMMDRAGQDNRRDPIPLLHKALEGMSNNGIDQETRDVVLFYFSRIGLNNPSILELYRQELKVCKKTAAWPLLLILWYARDAETQEYLHKAAKEIEDPQKKELFRKPFSNRKFADIDAKTKPIHSCRDIEILWAEYYAKGDMTAIKRIAEQVTAEDKDMQQALISVEASSSLAQRSGWFDEVRSYCESQYAKAVGREKEIWENITGRMKPIGDGMETIKCPIQRIELSGKEGRAMACGAFFPKMDRGKLDVLAAYMLDGENVRHTRKILNEWWTEGGRFELLMNIEWLIQEGHRTDFNKRLQHIAGMSMDRRDAFINEQSGEKSEWRIVCEYGPKMGAGGITAWDLSRVCMLSRFGYEAQYLSPMEVYRISIPTAIALQKTFDSWTAYGESFWIGRWYWRAREEDRDKAKAAVKALLSEANSPWKKYAWEMPLN